MPNVQKAASIYASLQNSGGASNGRFLDKSQKNSPKSDRDFKKILQDEMAKRKN